MVGPKRGYKSASPAATWQNFSDEPTLHVAATRCPAENFVVSATHTHSSNVGGLGGNSAPTAKTIADAVVKALVVYGVKESQMEAVSWGKEKPRAMGQTEVAFAQNRRADLTYPTK